MINLTKIKNCYRAFALIIFNFLVIIILLNVPFYIYYKINDKIRYQNPISKKYFADLQLAYPNLSQMEIYELLYETWTRPYAFDAFSQFKESPYNGRYVNVDKAGFRKIPNQGPWPPNKDFYNIFLFGGSSTFNYGLPDDETIASRLQYILNKGTKNNYKVYNFGRGYYYSSQERILFEKLLTTGFIPDMVIFIDGLNEFFYKEDIPFFTNELAEYFEKPSSTLLKNILINLPLLRFLGVTDNSSALLSGSHRFAIKVSNSQFISEAIKRYIANKQLIQSSASTYGVRAFFFWQPIPLYNYDLTYHLFRPTDWGGHAYAGAGYQEMKKIVDEGKLGNNFVWLADIQKNLTQPLYVDSVHYSAYMSMILANHIARSLK